MRKKYRSTYAELTSQSYTDVPQTTIPAETTT